MTTTPTFSYSSQKTLNNDSFCENRAFDMADDWFDRTGDGFVAGKVFEIAYNSCMSLMGI
ncbi:hypothetical protein [Ascidiimonas aurantiaca]|uniref:hypothetical protein n=1 Tax=Ascidiimonas aurantiaca TaxID=1685432 RepID=UPI0030EC51C8